jgi:hypothetical protein
MQRCVDAFAKCTLPLAHDVHEVDPRWDDEGFNRWADDCCLQWLRVDYLRSLDVFPAYQDCDQQGVHIGTPPNGVELFNVVHLYLGFNHCDPKGEHLADLLLFLKDADAADLVAIDWCATPQRWTLAAMANRDTRVDDPRTPEDHRRNQAYNQHNSYLTTYSPIRTIVLHRVPPHSERGKKGIESSVWITYELMLSAYCQRVVNSSDRVVKSMINPNQLIDPIKVLREGLAAGVLQGSSPVKGDVESIIVPNLRRAFGAMVPVFEDTLGFRSFCIAAEIAWVKIGYLRHFVRQLATAVATTSGAMAVTMDGASAAGGGRPFPRRQELPRGTFYVGLPPAGTRSYVVSHGWATEHHPSPSGLKLRRLVAALDADGASDDDGCFLDYMSLDQRARPGSFGTPKQRERTVSETRRFYLALWEMTRLFAFRECRVVVLPHVEGVEGPEDSVFLDYNQYKGRDCPRSTVWGWVNDVPYHRRGWCFAEFSCAYKAGVIVNLSDPSVQEVCRARDADGGWPTSVESYATMMQDGKIEFTSKGDREYVAYLFFKMCFDLRAVKEG